MKKDLTHNKIIADTLTDKFALSVDTVLVPLIEEAYPNVTAIQMYEDYLADKFTKDARWFYPLTVICGGRALRQWISWGVDKKRFSGAIPYSYVADGEIDFKIEDSQPEFEQKLEGRKIYEGDGNIKLKLFYSSADPLFPVGKFSQTFIDMMAKALTERISCAMGVSGLVDSVISLQLVFAPDTYMEHTSENVTYRRLKLLDATSAPRDLWIKWTRTDSNKAYSISDTPTEGTIEFELAENVSERIREREYRFLQKQGDGKFRSAMTRKNITEWRELIKRAVKRGELVKLDSKEVEKSDSATSFEEKIAEVAGLKGVEDKAPYVSEEPYAEVPEFKDTALEDALRKILGRSTEEESVTLGYTDDDNDLPWETDEKAEETVTEEVVRVKEVSESYEQDLEARLRREIEAKLRKEYEDAAKERAVLESQRLLDEHNKLKEENERLADEARRLNEIRSREEAARLASEDRLRAEMEAKERNEQREKERLAEAANLAVEEKKRLDKVRAEAEARIKEANRLAEEEKARKEAQRLLEEERARKEEEARKLAENAKEAQGKPTQPKGVRGAYTFTSKRVMFFFNSDVTENIIESMESVVRATIVENNKTSVPINIKASVQTKASVCLDFVRIPEEEEELLIKIIQALGKSRLGIVKARVE